MRLPRLPHGALRLMTPSRVGLWLFAFSSTAAALVVACLIALIAAHGATERRAQAAASATAELAAYDLVQTIGQYDRAIQTVIDRLRSPQVLSVDEAMRNLLLFDRAAALPGLAFINVLDDGGQVVSSPETSGLGSTWQGRDYFGAHRANPSLGTFVGHLFGQDDYGGFTISRRLSHPDGSFAGVVVAGLRLKYIRDLFERLPIGPRGSITLQRNDGMILMRRPYDRNDIGRIAANQSLSPQSDIHPIERQIGDLPLLLRVSVASADVANDSQGWIVGLLDICLLVAVLSGVLVLMLLREAKRRKAAERDNRNKSDYLAMTAHELRAPLHSVLGNAELLCGDATMGSGNLQHLAAIMGAGHHLRTVIDRVLNHLQVETRVPTPHMSRIDLVALVDECCIMVESEAAARDIAVHYGFRVDAPERFVTDSDLLRQTLLNLIGNAIKFTQHGEVSIEVGGTMERITVEVRDTGRGIPEDKRHGLFQQGERLGAERTAIPGQGIGLAVSKRLMQAMGGDIGYRENVPNGSIFWISLPAGTSMEGPAQERMPERTATVPLRVLLLDDMAGDRELASISLVEYGHTVTEASDGAQAAELAACRPFDVAVLGLDSISGIEASELIRNLPGRGGRVPIVGMVSDALDQRIIACRSLGSVHELVKPFSAHELLAMIDRTARQHGIRSADTDNGDQPPSQTCIAFDDVQKRLVRLTQKVEMLLADRRRMDGAESGAATSDLAHEVANLARLFGFGPLADAARRFADAVASNSPTAGDLAHALEAAARSTLPELRELTVSDAL